MLQSLSGHFTIDSSNPSIPDIVGTVSLAPGNTANWGVCRNFVNEPTESPTLGPLVTGDFYIINAGVLTYQVTAGPPGIVSENGDATAYFMNEHSTFTCPGAGCGGPRS